jgi:hypothetical protein
MDICKVPPVAQFGYYPGTVPVLRKIRDIRIAGVSLKFEKGIPPPPSTNVKISYFTDLIDAHILVRRAVRCFEWYNVYFTRNRKAVMYTV